MPIHGSTFISAAIFVIARTSESFSAMRMTFLPMLASEKRHADVAGVLVAVADDQRFGIAVHREAGEDLRLRSDFESVVERLAGVEDLFHDLAQLVHLDREHAAIHRLVFLLGDRADEGVVERLDAMPQKILKADQQRSAEAHGLGFAEDVDDRNGDTALLERSHGEVTARSDAEVTTDPTVEHVQRRCLVHGPIALLLFYRFFGRASSPLSSFPPSQRIDRKTPMRARIPPRQSGRFARG
jgi:hypothetical protein